MENLTSGARCETALPKRAARSASRFGARWRVWAGSGSASNVLDRALDRILNRAVSGDV